MRALFDKCNVWKRWVQVYQSGKHISDYFIINNYKKIAIYGMADVGDFLCRELVNSNINVKYGIDLSRKFCSIDIPIRTPDEIDDDLDVIIVTALSSFSDIFDMLLIKINDPNKIIGLDEVLASLIVEDKNEMEKQG